MPNLAEIFACLSRAPRQVSSDELAAVERYFVLLYQRTSTLSHVNDARKQLFAFGNQKIENIAQTLHALEEHVKRAVYQAGHIWGQCLIGAPQVPSPDLWGWQKIGDSPWTPRWTTVSEAATACHELLKCSSKMSCAARCKCFKAGLRCTQLCFCTGQCNRE